MEDVQRFTLRLPNEVYTYLKERAKRNHRTLTAEIREIFLEVKRADTEKTDKEKTDTDVDSK